jgi:hypothetical protein
MNPDFGTSEAAIVKRGFSVLTSKELVGKISGKTVWGDYGQMFKFVSVIHSDGNMEGKNNAGAHNFGKWASDEVENTFSAQWDAGWDTTVTRAYEVDGSIIFFDVSDGNWRTTFTKISDGLQQI